MSVQEMMERYGTFHRMFEFHHINPETKAKNYNNLIRQKISTDQLEEIDKCVLLCRQCHGVMHAQNIKAKLNLTVDYGERSVSQEFNGQIIYDAVENQMRFFSEEKILLNPYILRRTNEEDELLFGVDLGSGTFFKDILGTLEGGEQFEVFFADSGKLMLRATHTGKNIKVEHNIGFGFLEIEANDKQKKEFIWYRNGLLLNSTGEVISKGVINYTLAVPLLP
jgi:hypothetical protein